jgi:heme/copper-type cytochrome/quinol oxidase subunit 2
MKVCFGIACVSLLMLSACGTSQMFTAIPSGIDRDKVPHETIEMTAEHFHFTPEVVKVKQGTLVTINVKAIDGTHGFKLGAFGIDERIEEGETKTIEFYAETKGEYSFRCSHFCGIGHLGMTGKVVVE